jgi:hypothetical protein
MSQKCLPGTHTHRCDIEIPTVCAADFGSPQFDDPPPSRAVPCPSCCESIERRLVTVMSMDNDSKTLRQFFAAERRQEIENEDIHASEIPASPPAFLRGQLLVEYHKQKRQFANQMVSFLTDAINQLDSQCEKSRGGADKENISNRADALTSAPTRAVALNDRTR